MRQRRDSSDHPIVQPSAVVLQHWLSGDDRCLMDIAMNLGMVAALVACGVRLMVTVDATRRNRETMRYLSESMGERLGLSDLS